MRSVIRVTTETILIFGFAGYIYLCVNKWIGVFIALVAIMAIFPKLDMVAYWRREAILMGTAWYVLLTKLDVKKDHIFNAVCVIAIINAVFGILQFFGLNPYGIITLGFCKSSYGGAPVGLMTNSNGLAVIIAVSFPLFLRDGWKRYLIVMIPPIIFIQSTSALIAISVISMIWMYPDKTIKSYFSYLFAAFSLALLIAIFAMWIDHDILVSISKRMEYITVGLSVLIDYPYGVGLGHWHVHTNQLHAHNDVLQMIIECGIISVVPMAGYFLSSVLKADKMEIMIIAGITIMSLMLYPWFMVSAALIMVSLLAMVNKGEYTNE